MNLIIDYHHYKANLIDPLDRVAMYERYVIDMLLESELKDEQRESSIAFELKHHHSTAQFARLLARQRNLPIDVCTVGALLHDIHVIKYGNYKNHAHKSADLAFEIIDKLGGFSIKEKTEILSIIYHHSDKDIWSKNPFEEFGKDVDTLECFLYPNAFGYYLKHKPLPTFVHYIKRGKKLWCDLNIPNETDFEILDNYESSWMNYKIQPDKYEIYEILKILFLLIDNKNLKLSVPTFCFYIKNREIIILMNEKSWRDFSNKIFNNFNISQNCVFERLTKILHNITIQNTTLDIILEEIKKKNSLVVVWSAIKSYEILVSLDSMDRINELGIKEIIY